MNRTRKAIAAVCILLCGGALTSCNVDLDDLYRMADQNGAYVITVQSSNDYYGYTGIYKWFEDGTLMCRIEAVPFDGYRFVNWNDSITENPYTFVVTKSEGFTANFEPL